MNNYIKRLAKITFQEDKHHYFSNVQTVCFRLLCSSYYPFHFNYFNWSQKKPYHAQISLEASRKFILSPDSLTIFYVIQSRKTH